MKILAPSRVGIGREEGSKLPQKPAEQTHYAVPLPAFVLRLPEVYFSRPRLLEADVQRLSLALEVGGLVGGDSGLGGVVREKRRKLTVIVYGHGNGSEDFTRSGWTCENSDDGGACDGGATVAAGSTTVAAGEHNGGGGEHNGGGGGAQQRRWGERGGGDGAHGGGGGAQGVGRNSDGGSAMARAQVVAEGGGCERFVMRVELGGGMVLGVDNVNCPRLRRERPFTLTLNPRTAPNFRRSAAMGVRRDRRRGFCMPRWDSRQTAHLEPQSLELEDVDQTRFAPGVRLGGDQASLRGVEKRSGGSVGSDDMNDVVAGREQPRGCARPRGCQFGWTSATPLSYDKASP
ncbi:hypothetical protein B0H10DRAFT_1968022 [Mycena sp. CBHHK59/15]|nr:hypothetical protein B0H10DRAFT_1968022 [Mycena sp. CBHHK59/15]